MSKILTICLSVLALNACADWHQHTKTPDEQKVYDATIKQGELRMFNKLLQLVETIIDTDGAKAAHMGPTVKILYLYAPTEAYRRKTLLLASKVKIARERLFEQKKRRIVRQMRERIKQMQQEHDKQNLY